MTRTITCAMLAGLLTALPARGEDAKSETPAKPAAVAPADRKTEVAELIIKLGHDDPKVRQDATDALRKIGKDALPALKEAKGSEDLEVSSRAEALLKKIDEDSKPRPAATPGADFDGEFGGVRRNGNVRIMQVGPGGNVRVHVNAVAGGAGHAMAISRSDANGVTTVKAQENDRTVKIVESADKGVEMTVTEPGKDGKPETKEYKAKDADELKKDHPEAHKLYERFMAGNGGQIQINGVIINGGAGPGAVGGVNGLDPQMRQMIEAQQQVHQKMAELQVRNARRPARSAPRSTTSARPARSSACTSRGSTR
ncbi:MAG TPA: hypothetical protein VEA69_11700, partial [Tepidisphaeraceae bacterium]|nr:hypothetical protein [Tepidisphaeraceae bacterium]